MIELSLTLQMTLLMTQRLSGEQKLFTIKNLPNDGRQVAQNLAREYGLAMLGTCHSDHGDLC